MASHLSRLLSKNSSDSGAFLRGVFRPSRTDLSSGVMLCCCCYVYFWALDQPQKLFLSLLLVSLLVEMKNKCVRIELVWSVEATGHVPLMSVR